MEPLTEQTSARISTRSFLSLAWRNTLERKDLMGWYIAVYILAAGTMMLAFFGAVGSMSYLESTTLAVAVAALGMIMGMVLFMLNGLALLFAVAAPTTYSYREGFRAAWRYFLPVLLVSFYTSAIMLVGFIALILPALVLTVYIGMTQFVIANERRAGIWSIARSISLVYGQWWFVVKRMATLLLVAILLSMALEILLSIFEYVETPAVLRVVLLVLGTLMSLAAEALLAVYMLSGLQHVYLELGQASSELEPSQRLQKWTKGGVIAGVVIMILAVLGVGAFVSYSLENMTPVDTEAMMEEVMFELQQ